MTTQQQRILVGGLIGAAVPTAVFLLIPKDALIVTLFLFLLLSVVVAVAALWQLSQANRETYLTTLAFPLALKGFLALEAGMAVAFCALHLSGGWSIPVTWYAALQVVLLAVTAWKLLAIGAAKEMIDDGGAGTKAATSAWKLLQADAEAVLPLATPESRREVEGVVEAIRYADPVSVPEVSALEEEIRSQIVRLKELASEKKEVSAVCQDIRDAVRDRATHLKALK